MFERRLRWFVILIAALTAVIALRLVDIQVVRAAEYEALADRQLTQPTQYLRATRGAIRDRAGRVLAVDVPSFDVSVHYALLSGGEDRYLAAVARELRRRGEMRGDVPLSVTVEALRAEVARMWSSLAAWSGVSMAELRARAARIHEQVQRVKRVVQRSSPTVHTLREEEMLHPLLEDVPDELALRVREELEHRPWIRTVPSSHRVALGGAAFAHVLGRLGAASPEQIERDPLADDELRALTRHDLCGISGVERVAETTLRGTRGRIIESFDRQTIERLDPVPGEDVRLTIDAELQQFSLDALGAAVEKSPHPAGGAAVVLDVETRDVLALVSYPTYAPQRFHEDYEQLRSDTRRAPLRFRAVANDYPPGSTCKVITLYGGLADQVVSEHARIHCTGHFLPNDTGRFRCWIYNQYPGVTHDMRGLPEGLNASDALRNSCNIYFFTVGDRLGVDRLCRWFHAFGLGRTQGTGLIEEADGIAPDSAWLARHRPSEPRAQPADAWNYSIGQGEVSATPLQAANVIASVAAGQWCGVTLVRGADGRRIGPPPPVPVRLEERHLRILREGLWRVVNERGGTAYAARLESEQYVLCGKTGSAQAVPLVLNTRYVFEWPDGQRQEIVAISREDAERRWAGTDPRPKLVGWRAQERFPPWQPGEALPAHAWFIGYTQPAGTPRGAAPHGKVYAISVLIEFGGSGGNVAAPVAKKIAEYLLRSSPEWG